MLTKHLNITDTEAYMKQILLTLQAGWTTFSKGWKSFWSTFHTGYKWAGAYKSLLFIIGLLAPKKTYPETDRKHSYGIIICARNERLVIGNLIDSIHAQNYDQDKLKIFVVADNCDDDTAEICRQKGCIVYERFDKTRARKGWAMEYLFDKINEDYGIESLDGYVVFDADNLLHPNFMTELNKAFDSGANIVVGYRNTKNFDRNFISAGYGIHFMRSAVQWHRARGWLNISTHIAGTGFLVASHLLKDGWHYTCLTEDTQFTMNSVAQGEFIAFCEDAEFFDEQPYEVKVMARQRMRWTKGRLYSFFSTLPRLFLGIFTKKGRKAFSCYDMIMYCFPGGVYYAFRSMVIPFLKWFIDFILSLLIGDAVGIGSGGGASSALSGENPALLIWGLIASPLTAFLVDWGRKMVKGALVVLREHEKIHCAPLKLVLYTILFPWFDLINGPLSILALFSTSKWKPIKHDAAISIDQLTDQKSK